MLVREERRFQVLSDNPIYTEALRLLLTVKSWKLIIFSHSFSADASGYSEERGRLEVKNHEVHRLNVECGTISSSLNAPIHMNYRFLCYN